MGKLDLSVIILSYNTKDITLKTLSKLKVSIDFCKKKLGNKIETLVLDNASDDGSAQAIKSDFPWVKLTASDENLGFSKGNNLILKKVKSPYILLLNSDVYLKEESLYKALAYFRVNLNCDVMGAKLLYPDGRFQPSAGNLPNPLNILFWILGISNIPIIGQLTKSFHPNFKTFFKKAHNVGWVSGAFFMIKRGVFLETLGFDENIFMYMEEVEWCKRIKDKGFKIWYASQIEVTHLHGASSNFDMRGQYVNELKGIKYYFKKHNPFFGGLLKLFYCWELSLESSFFPFWEKAKEPKLTGKDYPLYE